MCFLRLKTPKLAKKAAAEVPRSQVSKFRLDDENGDKCASSESQDDAKKECKEEEDKPPPQVTNAFGDLALEIQNTSEDLDLLPPAEDSPALNAKEDLPETVFASLHKSLSLVELPQEDEDKGDVNSVPSSPLKRSVSHADVSAHSKEKEATASAMERAVEAQLQFRKEQEEIIQEVRKCYIE